ncbi:MAG TPA: hypothetical protein VKV21_03195 [Solirubrobacteraceae bacterium]|nr:hypothetical protein [Solirubrobacteraceae bacterium]
MATLTEAPRPAPLVPPEPLRPPGLIMDFETIAQRLAAELRRGPTLDAFLLAAGLAQIADDHLHAPTYPWGPAARYLAGHEAGGARLAGRAAAAIDSAAWSARSRRASMRALRRWRLGLDALLDSLAREQIVPRRSAPAVWAALPAREPSLPARTAAPARDPAAPIREPGLPTWNPRLEDLPHALRDAVVTLPSCFAHFDQRPADVAALAARFAERRPERDRPLLVVGVRTSGSYLAPLCAAWLRTAGFRRVATSTVRPGHRLTSSERALVSTIAARDGVALLLDDPPVTGGSVREAATMLMRVGMPPASIVPLLALFAPAEPPRALRELPAVLLAPEEWAVHADLSPRAVTRALESLHCAGEVLGAEPVTPPVAEPARGHRRALFRITIRDECGEPSERLVVVEGVGLGYLGAHRLAAPALVERYSPPVLGLRDGLLYREWLPEEQRLRPPAAAAEPALAAALADYVAARREALPCARDRSGAMASEQPAWLIASRILAGGFGRAWPAARVLLTDRATRRLLRVGSPSLVDGNTDLALWFAPGGEPAALRKPDVGEDRYSNLTAQCFDAAYDLAGVAARLDGASLPRALRRAYLERTGEAIGPERWLLYELVHLWGRERTQPGEARALRRARARALQRYFAEVYLADVNASGCGPLCALDIDGVLESQALGFPALTPASALALRALLAHGHRPVPATGRSLGEVAERCRAYGLAGGVAEYGSVTFRAADGRSRSLVGAEEAAALERLCAALGELDEVELDFDYRHVVRASRRGGPVPEHEVTRALAAARAAGVVRVVRGEGQTDFVARGVDKGAGLRALARELGCVGPRPYALAVGDTASDLPLAEVAQDAWAPGHADPGLRLGGFGVARRPYQAGLAEIVASVVGHRPGGCPRCRMPAESRDRAIARGLLGAAEGGRLGIVPRALELRWRSR